MNLDKKTTLGLIVGSRGFFNPELAANGRQKLLSKLDNLDYDYVITPKDATPNGAIETREDAAKCAKLFKESADRIDGVVVALPNFGDELGVVQTLDAAKLDVPVLVQAFDDDLDKLDFAHRRDAFCGKLSVCNNLYQYDIPFTLTSRHTCKIESDVFAHDLDFFARVCRVVKGLKNLRVGAIGARPAAFQTVRYSEKLLQAGGITVVPVDFSEILAYAKGLADDENTVKDSLASIKSYGKIPSSIPKENVVRQAKLSVAINQWMEENDCQASAIQCWTSVQENFGCATCLTMSMMGEMNKPSACEVDVAGAVSMYTLLLASGHPPGFQDWNNNYGDDPDRCINTHCSNYPKSFIGKKEVEISNLDILGESLGADKCFGAVKGRVAAGPMTFFRISTDDTFATIKSYLGEGEFTDDPIGDIKGGIAVCKVPDLQNLLKYICKNGFEHHVAAVRSHCADVVEEAVGNYMGWELYHHQL